VKLVFYNNMNRLIFVFYLFIVLSYVLCVFFFLKIFLCLEWRIYSFS
jgi:hypothetical protein